MKMMKRGLCGLLIAAMVLTVVPATFAQETVEIEGVIESIDLEASTVAIGYTDENGIATEVTLTITEDTQIAEAEAPITIGDLAVGDTVSVAYDPATMTVISIEVSVEEEQPEVPEEKTPGFEAIVALIAIALAGAGVALRRKKK
jgi:PGF-CTERM protein